MKRTILLLALVSAAVTAHAAGAQVYKWTDAQGIVHYSDAPPPTSTQNVQTVHVGTGQSQATDGGAAPADDASATPPANNSMASAAAPANDDQSKCTSARKNLEMLQSKYQIGVTGADGKTTPIDDKTRQIQVAATTEQVKLYCH